MRLVNDNFKKHIFGIGTAVLLNTLGVVEVDAANILIVSREASTGDTQYGTADAALLSFVDGLSGHTAFVDNVGDADASKFGGGPPSAAYLAGANPSGLAIDMVVVGRSTNSGDYGGTATDWNTMEVPLLLLGPHIARTSRWGFLDSTTLIDNTFVPEDFDTYTDPTHPFVNGLGTSVFPAGVTIDAVNSVDVPVGATIVAEMTTTAGDVTFASIVDYPEGTEMFNGLGVAGARRVLFQMWEHPDRTNPGEDEFALSDNGYGIFNNIINELVGTLPLVPGDVNGDGVANLLDFDLIKLNYNTANSERTDGNLDFDDDVDFDDYFLWTVAYRDAGNTIIPGIIPEPASIGLLTLAGFSLIRRRRG